MWKAVPCRPLCGWFLLRNGVWIHLGHLEHLKPATGEGEYLVLSMGEGYGDRMSP
jgi:hypothetical protein